MSAAFLFADTTFRIYLAGLAVTVTLLIADSIQHARNKHRHDREGD